MGRVESKFFISLEASEYLRFRFSELFSRDINSQRAGKYPVFSKYFDTRDLKFFYDKINGERLHLKIRYRTYARKFDCSGPYFLEAKYKIDAEQVKWRVRTNSYTPPTEWGQLEHPQMDGFLSLYREAMLYPVCNVFYEREAFLFQALSGASVRLNFDTQIRAFHSWEDDIDNCFSEMRSMHEPGLCLLELKCEANRIPDFLISELKAVGAMQTTFSKYATAILVLNETLDQHEVTV